MNHTRQINHPIENPSEALTPEMEDRYLKAAINAAQLAGKVQMASFGQNHKIITKGTSIDLVTAVDKECDELIVSTLRKHSTTDQFLTEESFVEGTPANLENTWVIDPLDGTTNYAHGFPHFAVSIAYFRAGLPVVGVVYDAFKKELFYAIHNRGAFLNDEPIFVSKNRVHNLEFALLATGFPYDIASSETNNIKHFERIAPRCHGVRRPGAAALDMAYVACSRLDGFWELKLSLWDIAAGALLVQEAGGKVTSLQGGSIPYTDRRIHLIGSNGNALHQELEDLLALDRQQG